jgi:hypothetical protein
MNIAFQKRMRLSEQLASYMDELVAYYLIRPILRTKNNDRSGAITDLFILRSTKLDHVLCSRMSNLDFTQNCVSIVC